MAGLDSDKVEKALSQKMQAVCRESKDRQYIIYNDQKKQVSRTRLSQGAKHSLGLTAYRKWPISWVLKPLSNFVI
jgi:hypothetical protein